MLALISAPSNLGLRPPQPGLLLGAGQALGSRGPYGLVHLDGHTDFRQHLGRDRPR